MCSLCVCAHPLTPQLAACTTSDYRFYHVFIVICSTAKLPINTLYAFEYRSFSFC